MITVTDIRETRAYREAYEEGFEKGRAIGRQQVLEAIVRNMLEAGWPEAEIADAVGRVMARLPKIKKAIAQ